MDVDVYALVQRVGFEKRVDGGEETLRLELGKEVRCE